LKNEQLTSALDQTKVKLDAALSEVEQVNALRAENARQAQEIESLKARLAISESENRQTDDMIYGKL
jgi:hypothetical protein